MPPSYDELQIKEYRYWTLFLHSNQTYLGRSYAWLKRIAPKQRLSDISHKERDELWDVIVPGYEAAIDHLWKPDHMNYSWLGNEFDQHAGQGHLHLIPRYQRPLRFAEIYFCDDRWGKNYAPYPPGRLPLSTLFFIRDTLRTEIR